MDRRKFFEQVTAWCTGLSLTTPVFDISSILAADAAEDKAKAKPLLAVAKDGSFEGRIDRVLKPWGGMSGFVHKGARVVVKPNISFDRTPEQAANTNPDIVKVVVQRCLDAGAKQVMVFDNSYNEVRRSYARSGIKAAVESIDDSRAQCVFMDKRKFMPVKIDNAKSIKEFKFYEDVMETACDCYINLPIAKQHVTTKLTMGLKNIIGIVGGNRGELHSDLHQRIADLNLVVRPTLTILDATRVLLRNGPAGGNLADVKVFDTLIASTDTVATDAYAATTIFGMRPKEIEYITAAFKHGLGEMDLSKIKIVNA